jgi:ornithine cyclodeaminase
VRCGSTAEAVRGADIVTTVTADKRNATILTPRMIVPGMHLNAIGGDCPGKTELDAEILLRPDARVVVEYEPQSRIEGEIQQLESGFPVVEFADVVRGSVPGRDGRDEVTIFDSVGFALEDYSSLRFLQSLLLDERSGRRQVDLVPDLEDPKDLYGGTLGQGRMRPRLRATG